MERIIAPSILASDFANLQSEVEMLNNSVTDWIHVDVMDGHFVPNITIGAPVVKSIKPVTKLPLDVHLMIENPENYIADFAKAGADYITVHIESLKKPNEVLQKIKDLGAKAGITLRPGTDVETIIPFLEQVSLVLVMTVEPGFGGQSFMRDQVEKINRLKSEIDKLDLSVLIEVDGGINADTAKECLNADVLVAGSYVFKNDYAAAIESLKAVKA